jgi:nicotinate-nucleotide--dimethylbenzimidazole phosphoribosyltransferase
MNRLHAELRRVQVASGQGLAAGRAEADRIVDAGADFVVFDSDVRSSAALAALAAVLDLEAVAVIGTTPYDGWHAQVVEVRDLLRTARTHLFDPETLAEDPVLGRVTGLLHQLAVRRTPVLLGGGATATIGALLAQRILPGAERLWIAASQPLDQAGRLALTAVGLTPLLDLGLGEGSADLAVALVRTGLEQLGA